MGSMGIIVSVIFRVEKKYWLREKATGCNWREIVKLLQKGKLWNEKKPKNRCHFVVNPYGNHNAIIYDSKYSPKDIGSDSHPDKRRSFSNTLTPRLPNAGELTNIIFRLFPMHSPELIDHILKSCSDRVYTDLSYKVMNMPFTDDLAYTCRTIQVAFPIEPINQLIEQIEKLFTLIEYLKRDIGYLTVPISFTFVNKSSAHLAMNSNSPVCFIEICSLRDTKNSLALIKRIEEEVVKHGGICHWGLRYSNFEKQNVKDTYPHFEAWSRAFSLLNGQIRTFTNSFTDDIFLDAVLGKNSVLDTVGPFREAKEYKRKGLVRYNPQDIHRDFPHIAKGSYGVVFKGKVADIPVPVAIKDMDIVDSGVIEDWKKELTVMNQNQSAYVVDVYGYSNDRNVVTIIMEFMTRGDLFSILHKKNLPLSILQTRRMARHCALGISLLHQHQVFIEMLNLLIFL
jgi:hypothetical protein